MGGRGDTGRVFEIDVQQSRWLGGEKFGEGGEPGSAVEIDLPKFGERK